MKKRMMVFIGALGVFALGFVFFLITNFFDRGMPRLSYEHEILLGERHAGEIITVPHIFNNTGTTKLVLTEFDMNCSCTEIEKMHDKTWVPVQAITVQPNGGTSDSYRIRVSARGLANTKVTNSMVFRSNDPQSPVGRIDIIVNRIIGGYYTSPQEIIVGTAEAGTAIVRELEVYDTAATARDIRNIDTSNNDYISITKHVNSANKNKEYVATLKITIRPIKRGMLNESILLYTDGASSVPDIVKVSGKFVDKFEVHPDLIHLPRKSLDGDVYTTTCVIVGFEVTDFSLAVDGKLPEGISVDIDDDKTIPKSRKLRITLNPQSSVVVESEKIVKIRIQSAEKVLTVLSIKVYTS